MKKLKINKLAILLLIAITAYFTYPLLFNKTEFNAIYFDDLAYLKKNKAIFSGEIIDDNYPDYYSYTFCNGIPCGNWEYKFKNDLISKGEIIDNSILLPQTLKLITATTYYIDFWQEGELVTDEKYLTITMVLKNITSDLTNEYNFDLLAKNIFNDTKHLNFSYLQIEFADQIFNDTTTYKVEYVLNKDKNKIEKNRIVNTL